MKLITKAISNKMPEAFILLMAKLESDIDESRVKLNN